MIKRSTLRAQIATALRDEILAGRLPTGRHFTVKEIAEQFGVSATPVREALVDLAAQGLLDVEHHKGYSVHEFTLDDFRAMVEARTLIVDGIFHRAVARGTDWLPETDPAVLTSVLRRAESAQRAAVAGDLDVLIGYELRYWRELGRILSNPYISDFLDRMRVQCWAFTVPWLRAEHDLSGQLWARHHELAKAVQQRDAETAHRLISGYNSHALAQVEGCKAARAARPAPGKGAGRRTGDGRTAEGRGDGACPDAQESGAGAGTERGAADYADPSDPS